MRDELLLAPYPVRRGMGGPEDHPHGTRARYVWGCRCGPCRASNTRRYHDRQARAKELAAEISAPAMPVGQLWTTPDGTRRTRFYKRACPGVDGKPCPLRAHLRKDSKGGVCRGCREQLVWNGLVPASRARDHLARLSKLLVGRRAVSEACDVSPTVLHAIKTGRKRTIRAETQRRILSVDRGAVAAHSLVPAGPTWRRIGWLLKEGFSKAELARRLGYKTPALQFRKRRVLAVTAARVDRLYRQFAEVA